MARRLLLFAPMIDSEGCRLALAHYGIPYREERHLFGWVSLLALRYAGTVQVPALVGGGLKLAGLWDVAEHFDRRCPASQVLLPARQPLRASIDADWERFNGELATETAAFSYHHLLPYRGIMQEPFARGLPAGEACILASWGYPVLRMALTRLLGLSGARAADARTRILAIFDEVDARLADGRRYLAGDALTLADIAFAAAAAPLLLPDGYGAPMPAVASMPSAVTDLVAELRSRPAAAAVGRLYAELRRSAPPPAPGACSGHGA